MIALAAVAGALGALAAQASPVVKIVETRNAGEHHQVTLINKCGQGTAVFQDETGTVHTEQNFDYGGPLRGGVAWIKDAYGCGDTNALHCNDVEFTLANPEDTDGKGDQNAANYSFQQNGDQTHTFRYPVGFALNGCQGEPSPLFGPCLSPDNCPGVFTGTDATDGQVSQCSAENVGIVITFCG